MKIFVAAAIALFVFTSSGSCKTALSDSQVRAAIVHESRDAYHQSGRPCACPYDRARNGSRCGRRSAYNRKGGEAPFCYPSDVIKEAIDAYRAEHR